MQSAKKPNGVNSKSKTIIRVGVGYGWMKVDDGADDSGRTVLSDVFWNTIKTKFVSKHSAVEKDGVEVYFSRLRASHGKIVWMSVLERIKESDILIFDVALAPNSDKVVGNFNLADITKAQAGNKNVLCSNVLIEIGAAIALEKRVMLLCPKEFQSFIPSDLKGYLWTLYNWKGIGKNSERSFVDEYGMQNGYIAMLREVLNEKTNCLHRNGKLLRNVFFDCCTCGRADF